MIESTVRTPTATIAVCTMPQPPDSLRDETDPVANNVKEAPTMMTTSMTATDGTTHVHAELEISNLQSSLIVETNTSPTTLDEQLDKTYQPSLHEETLTEQINKTGELSLCEETLTKEENTSKDVLSKTDHPLYQQDTNKDSLCEETTHLDTSATSNIPDDDMTDKYRAAEGLLLLGTDVSSADDSQTLIDINTNINKDGNVSKTDSDKTIIQPSPSVNPTPWPTSMPSLVKSPKKSVLNFWQIGIKRHLPVDSSDPDAIGSPPGSPDSHVSATKPKRKRSAVATTGATQTKGRGKPKNFKDKQEHKTDKVSGKAKTLKKTNDTNNTTPKPPASVRRPSQPPVQQDQDGKYSIKRRTINGTTYYSCSCCTMKFDSLHGLNAHHEKKHPPVQCDVCNRLFTTPNSLIHHSYTHLEQSFIC